MWFPKKNYPAPAHENSPRTMRFQCLPTQDGNHTTSRMQFTSVPATRNESHHLAPRNDPSARR